MAKKAKIKERHKQILKVIQEHRDEFGYAPSYRDICDQTEITSTSMVNYYLEKLEEEELIEREENISRSLKLTQKAYQTFKDILGTPEQLVNELIESLTIPITGRIVASEPVPVPSTGFNIYDYESKITIADDLIPRNVSPESLFALEVEGDSMIDAMVNDGDIIILKPAQEAQNGDMVAVRINQDETTLKYFFKEDDRVRLQPANPTMDPIYVDSSTPIEIQGKVVLVVRQV
jgi:repressor LexA